MVCTSNQEGWQHLFFRVEGVGRQLRRRGGKTAIQDLITGWVPWKKLQNVKKPQLQSHNQNTIFLHFWCTSSFHWRGFSPSPSSWAKRVTAPTPSGWGSGEGGSLGGEGGRLQFKTWSLGESTEKNTKQNKITAPISLSKCKILQIVIFSSQEHSHVVRAYS